MKNRRINCPMRHFDTGNCLPAGGFCTAVNDTICEALHNAYGFNKPDEYEAEVDVIRKALADWRPELNHIIETLGTEELLAQLAEEAAELGKAALKLRRALDGKNPTPVSPSEALRNVREEMADVLLCSISVGLDERATERTIREKIPRWSGRIDHDPDSDCPGRDEGFRDDAGGYHEGGCGWDPLGRFCGECSCGDCGQCPLWARDTMPGGEV